MRIIIDCKNPQHAAEGLMVIQDSIAKQYEHCAYVVGAGASWLVRKTKTGFSAVRQP